MACEHAAQVHAHHDAELTVEDRLAVEEHLRQCAECRQLLADLRRISRLIDEAPLSDVPAITLQRLYQALPVRANRAVLRLASWMTAAAAAVLVAGLVQGPVGSTGPTGVGPAAPWEAAAVLPPAEDPAEPGAELVQVARWMATGLSPDSR